jgi:hypothetical protein
MVRFDGGDHARDVFLRSDLFGRDTFSRDEACQDVAFRGEKSDGFRSNPDLSREAGAVVFHLAVNAEERRFIASQSKHEGLTIHGDLEVPIRDAAAQFLDLH